MITTIMTYSFALVGKPASTQRDGYQQPMTNINFGMKRSKRSR